MENEQVPVEAEPVVVVPVPTVQLALLTPGAEPPQAVKLKPETAVAVRVTLLPLM